jgi:hypothetical protein
MKMNGRFPAAFATPRYVCCALRPVIPDEKFLGRDRPALADGCLWGLVPQSGPSPICAAYRSSAFGEHWEPRLPARSGLSKKPRIA